MRQAVPDGVDAVRLRLERQPEDAVAQVPRLGAVVLEHRAAALAERRQRGRARVGGFRDVRVLDEVEDLAVGRVEALRARSAHLLDRRRERHAVFLHAVENGLEADRVPRLEGAELPVVTPAHRFIDGGDVVGDLSDAPRGIGERP